MELNKAKIEQYIFLLILALGLFARLWLFGRVPGDINQDEALAAYESFSILTTGRDTAGYAFPVYLTAWGSGMNALESYLMLPFIAAFGLRVWAIRLPQLLVGVCSIWVLYLTAKQMMGRRGALFAAFLLAICPWHVLLSRWGLESNLAPGFLLFGLYFFLKGLENSRFFLLSALFYGLSLYTYATVWPFVPFIILLELIYCAATGQLRFDRNLLFSAGILFALALPLLLFLAVNFGLMEEIRTPFFSVPRLLYMRSGEISLENIPENLKNLFTILAEQSDGLPWNSAGPYGLLYTPTRILVVLGLVVLLRRVCRRKYRPEMLLLIQLLAGLFLGALVHVNVNRVNILFIPLVLLSALGLEAVSRKRLKLLLPAVALSYFALFLSFQIWYFTDYRQTIGWSFNDGLAEAVEAVEEAEGTVYVSQNVYYPDILFFAQVPAEEFRETVRYVRYPAAYLQAESFGRWHFGWEGLEKDGVYILSAWDDRSVFQEAGFTLTSYGNFAVARK